MFENYIGQVFDHRYRIDKVIGVGGMAVVFEAYDSVMKRSVAVKMLKDEIAHDTQSVKRFINESKAVAMLSHPNIVKIYDVSVKENRKYIVMERVEGITLKNYLNKKGTLGMREMLQYTEQILLALEHAHSKGVVHRDIKPQNILLLKNGVIKVTDFGIAKLPNAETVTMTDKAIGTVYYISPEQASGKKVDRRSDIYSLGVLMYEMCTGKLPFVADSPVSVALMHVKDQPKRPSDIIPSIPKGLEQIILAAMEKRPDKRIQSASQMLRLLDKIKKNPEMVFKTRKEPGEITKLDLSLKGGHTSAQRKVAASMFPIIAGVTCAFLIVASVTMIYFVQQLLTENTEIKTLTVDNLVGKTFTQELLTELDKEGYQVEHKLVDSDQEIHTIIRQSLTPGTKKKIEVGKTKCYIEIEVSGGPEKIILEDYSGQQEGRVKDALRAKGLLVLDQNITTDYSTDVPSGCVIRTDPPAGTEVTRGQSISIVKSAGSKINTVTLPQFVGMTKENAEKALAELNLKKVIWEEEFDETAPKGEIIKQDIPMSSSVMAQTTTLTLTVSKGPDKDK